ncbi:DNA (cytosine-5-)-methyltransferase [Enterobacter asburiae]|uniref:DNA (Cytosine-5-)-methyltransferase n=1 Tax=Enterobacter asburiae TaxID=61645 RepID=A0A376FDC9_ENTAS|nr:DNA (cytosine-5-)-methyltransferase [Enterobacter asburiae]
MRGAYYNEIDPNAAQWLRNLIAAGHIAPGEVDERSIEDVASDDLRGFTQCHFFAGIGVWSYALRLAGWPDNKPVWTGSCPCQPFSSAGKGAGFDDERHLWPALFHLISERRPELVFGEQVAGVNAWFDLVQTDVEAVDYAFGLVPFPAAGVGAPHIRDRAYWVADASGERSQRWRKRLNSTEEDVWGSSTIRQPLHSSLRDFAHLAGWYTPTCNTNPQPETKRGLETLAGLSRLAGWPSPLASNTKTAYQDAEKVIARQQAGRQPNLQDYACLSGWPTVTTIDNNQVRGEGAAANHPERGTTLRRRSENLRPNTINGCWDDADWLLCRDGRWRPVESGTFPAGSWDYQQSGTTARLRQRDSRASCRNIHPLVYGMRRI